MTVEVLGQGEVVDAPRDFWRTGAGKAEVRSREEDEDYDHEGHAPQDRLDKPRAEEM